MKIKKIDVSLGLYWIEVAEIDVRILCASPADSVKHLIKKGLIYQTETKGVVHESGPNMILLSDIMIQNSQFSNLSEFPVLQMLYRQGMILPNHPNNNGTKPTIIGDSDQVDTQISYIYRGNYGLVSIDELITAGASKEEAEEIMNMKLKFAFGKMVDSKDLLDKVYINDFAKVEIKDGLFIKRVDINVFEFTYEDDKVTVDLNLKHKEYYQPAYTLGKSNLSRDYFSVVHTGEGDGWDINRPCMGSVITFHGKIYLIDAGPHINDTLLSLGISVNEIDGVFMTHSHDDHFAGITSLIQSDHKLKFFSSKLVRYSIFKKLSVLLAIDFKHISNFFEVHDLDLDVWNNIDGLEVKPILVPHPIETNIFYFRAFYNNGFKSFGHLADLTSFSILKSMVVDEKGKIGVTQEYYDRTVNNYLEKATLKKVDIGGGMIHGSVNDFKNDRSNKLLLSHTSVELTEREKQLGSSAPFGTIDVLIKAEQNNYFYKYAYTYLHAYFPEAPSYAIKMILNYEIKTFNPQSIIIKDGEVNHFIYLILTGNVEMIQADYGIYNTLSAGAMIGLINGILGIESNETYRSDGYINALAIPAKQFEYFVNEYGLAKNIEYTQDRLSFLQSTYLFGESISYKILGDVINSMKVVEVSPTDKIEFNTENLYIVQYGAIDKYCNGELVGVLKEGDFLNYIHVLFDQDDWVVYGCKEDVILYEIEKKVVKNIPVVYSKLFESYKKESCNMKILKGKESIL